MPATSTSSRSGPNMTRCGLPMSTVRTLRSTNFCGWSSPSTAGPMPDRRPGGVRIGTLRIGDGPHAGRGGDREGRGRHQSVLHGGLGQAAHPVAAHLGLAAVGVLQHHGQVGRPAAVEHPDDPVGTHAEAPVAQGPDQVGGQGATVLRVDQDQEVVAGTVVLGEPEERRCREGSGSWRSPTVSHRGGPSASRSTWPSTTVTGSSPGSIHSMRGSRRNHARWRLAKARVRRIASSTASDERHPVLDVGQQLAVAEGLAGRPRQARRVGPPGRAPRRGSPSSISRANRSLDPAVRLRRRHGACRPG